MRIIAALLTCMALACAEPGDGPKQAFTAYLKAFAAADTDEMAKSYAKEVTVKRRSTLLGESFGLVGNDGAEKDKLVKRDALLEAYRRAFKVFGGRADWMEKGKELLEDERIYIDHESKVEFRPGIHADRAFQTFGAERGDVLVIVNPKGDSAVFQLRQVNGVWKVVGEYWD
jgi:hypothetical protein